MDDLPVLKKCCFCVPLRYGLLTWGYLKLAAVLVAWSFFILILTLFHRYIILGDFLFVIIVIIFFFLTAELVLHIMFIVGAHMKRVTLLKIYYYYAIFVWLGVIILAIAFTSFILATTPKEDSTFPLVMGFNVGNFALSIAAQTFLLLALRSEIIKLRSNCPYRFVKDSNEPEGIITTVKYDEENILPIENGTGNIYERECI